MQKGPRAKREASEESKSLPTAGHAGGHAGRQAGRRGQGRQGEQRPGISSSGDATTGSASSIDRRTQKHGKSNRPAKKIRGQDTGKAVLDQQQHQRQEAVGETGKACLCNQGYTS